MKLEFSKGFTKNYKKRILQNPSLTKKFQERTRLFKVDPKHKSLKDHKLTGSLLGFRAFSITGDIRVIYRKEGDLILLYDIGSHNQVY